MPNLYKKRGKTAWLVPCKNSTSPLSCATEGSAGTTQQDAFFGLRWLCLCLQGIPSVTSGWHKCLAKQARHRLGEVLRSFPRFLAILLTIALFCIHTACTPTPPPLNKPNTTTDSIPNPIRYLLFGSGKKSADKSDALSLAELKSLQKGDILLRKGYGAISDYISDFLQEQYPVTHCGFVVQDGDSLAILHTISTDTHNGMLLEPLSSYVRQSQAGSLVAVRMKTDNAKIEKALHLAQLLLSKKIPFDMGFDDKNASSLYCLEMVRNVLKEVFQKDILPKRQTKHGVDVLSMDNFFDTTYFEIVFNHFDR